MNWQWNGNSHNSKNHHSSTVYREKKKLSTSSVDLANSYADASEIWGKLSSQESLNYVAPWKFNIASENKPSQKETIK